MNFAQTFKALSNPIRRSILELLKEGKLSAGDIAGHFDVAGATISHHFKPSQAGRFNSRGKREEFYLL